jgi:hypothetical protein
MSDLARLLELLRREAVVFIGTPVLSLTLGAVCFALGWLASRLDIDARTTAFTIQNETLSRRLGDYQKRFGEAPTERKYGQLTDVQLRVETERFLGKLKYLHERIRATRAADVNRLMRRAAPADEASARQSWLAEISEMERRSSMEHLEFVTKFRGDALSLGEEIERRLPPDEVPASRHAGLVALQHGMLVGPDAVGEIIASLDRLAKHLPEP